MSARVVAITGSYRKDGTTDAAVEAVLAGAREKGAVTSVVRLTEKHLEFCTNCRQCTQTPGEERGKCPQKDDLEEILLAVEASDAVVVAAPVNDYNVTAIFRRFLERLLGYAYWPWGQNGPRIRSKARQRKAVLISVAAMPGFLIPLATGAARALKLTAAMFGSRVVGKLWIGLAAHKPHQELSARVQERARRLGWKLA
ncbi:MAG: flavodoxin family protein [Terracidiphilus sp.]|nr:flavodoxin family protein [Terracidiphilus sp.]